MDLGASSHDELHDSLLYHGQKTLPAIWTGRIDEDLGLSSGQARFMVPAITGPQ